MQIRGFCLAIEKIDLSFPAGFHIFLLGKVRRSDMIEFQSIKGVVTKMIEDWILLSVHILCHVPATGLYMLTLLQLTDK